jgi:hypothetical protein
MHIAVTVIGCGPTGLLLSGALAGRGHRRSPSTAGAQALVEDDPLRLRRLRMYSWQRLDLGHTAPTTRCRRLSVARGPAARSRQLQPERGCPAGQPAAPGTVPRRPYSLQQVNPERGDPACPGPRMSGTLTRPPAYRRWRRDGAAIAAGAIDGTVGHGPSASRRSIARSSTAPPSHTRSIPAAAGHRRASMVLCRPNDCRNDCETLSTRYTVASLSGSKTSAAGVDLQSQAARSYSLIRPPRMGRRLIRWCAMSGTT